jgi:hypothetical protein
MEATTLTLLTNDGPLKIAFRPSLSAAQYSQLADFITLTRLRTTRELCDELAILSGEWGVSFECGGVE